MRMARDGAGIASVEHHFAEPYLRSGELEPVLTDWRCRLSRPGPCSPAAG